MKKTFFKNLSLGLILEAIKYVTVYLIGNSGFYLLLKWIRNYFQTLNSTWVFWTIIILFALLLGIILFQRFNRHVPFFSIIESNFRLLEYHIIHKVVSEKEAIHKRTYKLEARRNGLTSYKDKFMWTGSDFTIASGDNRHKVILSNNINVFDTYIIDFDRTYNRKEIIEATVIWHLKGEGKPFISYQAEEPTDKVILSLEFAEQFKISEADFEIMQTQGSKRSLGCTTLQLKNNRISQTINKPKLLHLYQIKWRW